MATAMVGTFESLLDDIVLANEEADEPLFHALGLRYLTRLFAAGMQRGETSDQSYPIFVPGVSRWLSWGYVNPDVGYNYAYLSGDHSYRLFGHRGSSRIFDIEIFAGDMGDMSTLHHFSGSRHVIAPGVDRDTRGLQVAADGSFEVVLSPDRQPGNWIQIPPGPSTVVTRELFYDWENENRADLLLERIGAVYPPPAPSTQAVHEALEWIPKFLRGNGPMLQKGIQLQHYSIPANTMRVTPQDMGEGHRGQDDQLALRDIHFVQGRFECGPHDAVIIEAAHLDTQYWTFYLTSHNWEAGDFHFRQTSINGFQAEIDPDGKFRAVISHRDPGVPNWLDPAAAPSGLILARYFKPEQSVAAPQVRVVPFDSLRDALPGETRDVTAAERSETLRRRMHSVRRRRCEF